MPTLASVTQLIDSSFDEDDLGRVALALESGDQWTYREFAQRVNCYAHALLKLGVQPGSRVAILLYNSLEYWALYLAVARISAIAVRVNFRLSARELEYVLTDSGAEIVCMHDDFLEIVGSVHDTLPAARFIGVSLSGGSADWLTPVHELDGYGDDASLDVALPTEEMPVMIMYTSGTTGTPKGAVWTHANSVWFAVSQALEWKFDRTTVAMTTGPLYHVGACEDLLLPALLTRGTAVMTSSGGFSVERMLGVLADRRVTDTLIYPFMIYEMLQHERLHDFDLSALRRIMTGGSSIAEWAAEQMLQELPGVELIPTYGLTEGGGITTSMPSVAGTRRHPDSVGRPIPFTEVQIVGPRAHRLGSEEIGEVWVRSPGVVKEYWQKPGASAETFVDGWCRTGDLGRLTKDGYLILSGRAKDMIKSGGENIYPIEVEQVLLAHPDVADAAVIGVPDDRYQETVCAVIVPVAGRTVTSAQIVAYCRTQLASYKKPRHVYVVSSLPRTPSGKVMKFKLREAFPNIGK
jgi:fatty-acyl-CoA synthase